MPAIALVLLGCLDLAEGSHRHRHRPGSTCVPLRRGRKSRWKGNSLGKSDAIFSVVPGTQTVSSRIGRLPAGRAAGGDSGRGGHAGRVAVEEATGNRGPGWHAPPRQVPAKSMRRRKTMLPRRRQTHTWPTPTCLCRFATRCSRSFANTQARAVGRDGPVRPCSALPRSDCPPEPFGNSAVPAMLESDRHAGLSGIAQGQKRSWTATRPPA